MSQRQIYSTKRLILRCLQPSAVSLFVCGLIAFSMVVVNIVLRSVDVGVALPSIFDGQWAIAYSEHVVQPLTELLTSNALNKTLIAVMWGFAGFLVYVGFEYGVHSLRELRQSRQEIRMARGGQVEQSPLTKTFWRGVMWRTGMLLLAIVFFFVGTVPLLASAFGIAESVILSENLARDGLRVILAVAEWFVCLHALVVFFRLYTMRTRLFGDEELY